MQSIIKRKLKACLENSLPLCELKSILKGTFLKLAILHQKAAFIVFRQP